MRATTMTDEIKALLLVWSDESGIGDGFTSKELMGIWGLDTAQSATAMAKRLVADGSLRHVTCYREYDRVKGYGNFCGTTTRKVNGYTVSDKTLRDAVRGFLRDQ